MDIKEKLNNYLEEANPWNYIADETEETELMREALVYIEQLETVVYPKELNTKRGV